METNEPVAIPTWYTFSTVTMGPRKIGYDECSNRGCNKTETLEMNFRRCSICKMPNYCSRECQAEDWKARHKRVCKTAKENVETMKEAGKLMQMFSDLSMTGGFEDAMESAAQNGQTFGEMVADNKKNNQAVRNRRKQIRKEKKRTIGKKAPDGPDPEFF